MITNEINNFDDEAIRYRKKSDSNKSKASSKSDHKHQYKGCLIRVVSNGHPENRVHSADYCVICGKLNNIKFFETIKTSDNHYRVMTNSDILDMYPDRDIFDINDLFQARIDLGDSIERL